MHVLILPSWYFSPDKQEIAGRMFHHLAGSLRDQGIDARVLYSSYSVKGPLFKKRTFLEEEGVPTWRTFQFFPPKVNTLLFKIWIKKYVIDVLAYIRKEGKPDVIHAQSYLAAAVCAALQDNEKIPYIYTERLSSFILENIPNHHYPFLSGCFEKASAITCVSPGLLDRMQPHTNQKIRVIPNFYDEQIFYPDVNVQKNPSFTWISVGEPAHIKGLDILFQAYGALKERLKEVPMQMILVDDIREKEELIKLAQTLGIERDLVWTGLISQTALAAILRTGHVLVSASRVETFGKAILEAHACGLPVVATRTDGAKYILTSPQQGELAEPGSPESLMHAMGKVYTGYSMYNANTIYTFVEKRFSRQHVTAQWIQCYKAIIG